MIDTNDPNVPENYENSQKVLDQTLQDDVSSQDKDTVNDQETLHPVLQALEDQLRRYPVILRWTVLYDQVEKTCEFRLTLGRHLDRK